MNRWPFMVCLLVVIAACLQATGAEPQIRETFWGPLSPEQAAIIENGGTERPFTGALLNEKRDGTYTCARCGAPLFTASTKFDSGTGWPSFDDAIDGAVDQVSDHGRTEIRCARCQGHLGHVFIGEDFTPKNTRHCVNSLSMEFDTRPLQEAFFAGGCFWGVEHFLEAVPGVLAVESGYMGGTINAPSYYEVSSGKTGHAEAVRVRYDSSQVSYETLTKLFFEIHDPTQKNRQGPDIGDQYRSAIFYNTDAEAKTVKQLVQLLEQRGYRVATEVVPSGVFWPAEAYHQDYYQRSGKAPYCHGYVDRFGSSK